jgi:hypothetical protein
MTFEPKVFFDSQTLEKDLIKSTIYLNLILTYFTDFTGLFAHFLFFIEILTVKGSDVERGRGEGED